jgi:glycosyltransferase involved in cell wall biosynthesis
MTKTINEMRICYFGLYGKSSPRNANIIKGLRQNNVEVVECWAKAHQRRYFLLDLSVLFFKYLFIGKYDAMIIGFPGRPSLGEVYLGWFFTRLARKPLIMDVFFSWYDSWALDRARVSRNSKVAKAFWRVDKKSCQLADLVLLDTNTHIDYFVKEFKLPREKFKRLFVVVDDTIFTRREHDSQLNNGRFIIHFHGTFIPLHGVDIIIKAAKILEKEKDIYFEIVGKGQTYGEVTKMSQQFGLENVSFLGVMPPEKIADYMTRADICLSIFGKTDKAKRVIPFKVLAALAMGKAVITGQSPAVEELLTNKENCYFCKMNDPVSLAQAILYLKGNKELRDKIAENGYRLYKEKCTCREIGKELVMIIEGLNNRKKRLKRA